MKKLMHFEKSPSECDVYFLIPLPSEKSFGKLIDLFNIRDKEINGVIKIDMIIYTGNRKGRFISARINHGVIDRSTFSLIEEDEFLVDLTKKIYANLSEGYLSKIYPIDFRNEIKKIREEL